MLGEGWQQVNQILQLIGVGPCLLLMSFLLLTLKEPDRALIPLIFLFSLGAGLIAPVLTLFFEPVPITALTVLMVIEGVLPAAIFLLVLQFLRGAMPTPTYWLILCLPLIGGAVLYYMEIHAAGELCTEGREGLYCVDSGVMFSLYNVLSGGVILLLIMPELGRKGSALIGIDAYKQDKFWLIIALILFTAALLTLDLFRMSDLLEAAQVSLLHTIIRLLFLFLMFASLFRVFSKQFSLDMDRIPSAQKLLSSDDEAAARKIQGLLEQQKLYREMGLSRGQLAEKLDMNEGQISHIVNRYFECNFNSLVNAHRIEEAKERLEKELDVSITVIAFEVGFNSIASFNRVFKEVSGMSPSEWRQKHH